MRILIAEDEIATARALQVLLKKNNYTVDIVHNGNDAWDYISTNLYDAIVLDIMMPGKSGTEVLKLLRKNQIRTPVLMLTARAELEDRIAGLDAVSSVTFADTEEISDWAIEAISWMNMQDLIRGRENNQLAPKATATRAEIANLFQRFAALVEGEEIA